MEPKRHGKFILAYRDDGDQVLLNPEHIACITFKIRDADGQMGRVHHTLIKLAGGPPLMVHGDHETWRSLLSQI